jgi:hypothetical protein
MPTVQVNSIAMYYERHGAGEPLLLIPRLRADINRFGRIIGRTPESGA